MACDSGKCAGSRKVRKVEEAIVEMRLYAIYDRVAEQGGPIFSAVNDGVAIRQYRALLQQVSPVDRDAYKLYLVGRYDQDAMRVFEMVNPSEIILEPGQLGLYTKEEMAEMIGGNNV